MSFLFHLRTCLAFALAGYFGAPALARANNSPNAAGTEGAFTEAAADEEQTRQRAIEEQQTRLRVQQLAGWEKEQTSQAQLEARHEQDRAELQRGRGAAWATVRQTNWTVYEALKAEAIRSPKHRVPCTLCDGRGSMSFCVICDGKGKCVRCAGSGKAYFDTCPTCRGSGECFLCYGTGKMPCIFCEDGDVYAKAPPPSTSIPFPTEPAARASTWGRLEPPKSAMETGSVEPAELASQSGSASFGQRISESNLGTGLALLLLAVLILRGLGPKIAAFFLARFDPWVPLATAGERWAPIVAEDKSFSEFLNVFRSAPPDSAEPNSADPAELATRESGAARGFLTAAPKQLHRLRLVLQEMGRTSNQFELQELLDRFRQELRALRESMGVSTLLPAWQLACALEGLVEDLAKKTSRAIPATLRTIEAALHVLEDLCRPGVKPDLCTNPPLRLLAVDDDPLSRHAISMALKKMLEQPPDLANDAEAALALLANHAYDLIFLDIEMPGMNGLELCRRIREGGLNRSAPVVFVTFHGDPEKQAQMAKAGSQDLLLKPFLIFELTVKALTLVLRTRLGSGGHDLDVFEPQEPAVPTANESVPQGQIHLRSAKASTLKVQERLPERSTPQSAGADLVRGNAAASPAHVAPQRLRSHIQSQSLPGDSKTAVVQLSTSAQLLCKAKDAEDRAKILTRMLEEVESLKSCPDLVAVHAIQRFSAALTKLIGELLKSPEATNVSPLRTMGHALDFLRAALDTPDLLKGLERYPLRVMIVDDDPICLQALWMSLMGTTVAATACQTAAEALEALAAGSYDVIFSDIMMPEMDGLEFCAQVRKWPKCKAIPLIFVTALQDFETRARSKLTGGCDFIAKPFSRSEVYLKAFTFGLRHRVSGLTDSPNSSPETELRGLLCLDSAGKIESMNPEGGRLLGYDPAEVTGWSFDELVPEELQTEETIQIVRSVMAGKPPFDQTIRVTARRKDTTAVPLVIGFTEHKGEGNRAAICLFRRPKEQLKEGVPSTASSEALSSAGVGP